MSITQIPGDIWIWTRRCAGVLILASAGAGTCQEPSFSLAFEGPTSAEGLPGSSVRSTARVQLSTEGLEPGGRGAQGWVLSLGAEGSSIVGATTQGTVAARLEDGGLLQNGFELTELTTGMGNEGAVSLVILSFNIPTSLDPGKSPHSILQVTVEGRVPTEDLCGAGKLSFVDGRHGSGLPLQNEITYRGKAFRPGTESMSIQFCSPACPEGVSCGTQRPGDCNQDGRLDISDAICILGALFLGTPSLFPCGDGTREHFSNQVLLSANGDPRVDLSDAVYLLTFLFLGGPPHVQGVECRSIAQCGNSCP